MQTRCPQCQTVFPLEADRPIGDAGLFACASCGAAFDAYAHLTEAAPADKPMAVGTDGAPAKPTDDQGELFGRPRSAHASAPRFARERIRIPRPPQWRWWLASLALLALLLAIYPIADRERLARDANWRPALSAFCGALGCALPPWRETTAFEVTARDVRPHPSAKGALLITVSFRNNAQFAQEWPLLELSMSDLNGREIGMRRFRAQEYLGSAPKAPLIAAGQSANATLEVVDPGRDAVAYNFEFR
jgi:predicted Zn finger-like uncharacterized protein